MGARRDGAGGAAVPAGGLRGHRGAPGLGRGRRGVSAAGCLCGREDPPRVGDPVEIGDVLGFMIEPPMRYGRVVGFIREDVPLESISAARVIVRMFRPGDGRWPSGGYLRAW